MEGRLIEIKIMKLEMIGKGVKFELKNHRLQEIKNHCVWVGGQKLVHSNSPPLFFFLKYMCSPKMKQTEYENLKLMSSLIAHDLLSGVESRPIEPLWRLQQREFPYCCHGTLSILFAKN